MVDKEIKESIFHYKGVHANHLEDNQRQQGNSLEEDLFLGLNFPSSLVSQFGQMTPQKFQFYCR